MKFIVDRRTWYRGKGSTESRLLRADGTRCCIGFVAQQSGVPDNEILDVASIHAQGLRRPDSSLVYALPAETRQKFPQWLNIESSYLIGNAYTTNDDQRLNEEDREACLKKIFEDGGDEIEFIN